MREAGEFVAGFSVVMAGWLVETPKSIGGPKIGVVKTKGHRTKTHTDYDAGRGTSYSACTAMANDLFGILLNDKGAEEVVKLAKGGTTIFS